MISTHQAYGDRSAARVDLPAATASWVLCAHAFTLLCPLLLATVAVEHTDFLAARGVRAPLLVAAAVLYIAGSAFEIGQNAIDRWYFTGVYPARWDFLFQLCIAAGSLCIVLSYWRALWWVWLLAAAAMSLVPLWYLRRGNAWPLVFCAGLAAAVALYLALGSPIVFLQVLVAGAANPFFLGLVTKTRAQSLHGALAFANGLGFLAIPWAIRAASGDSGPGWPFVISVSVMLLISGIAFRPILNELGATPRCRQADAVSAQ